MNLINNFLLISLFSYICKKIMMKKIGILLSFVTGTLLFHAQVGINTITPQETLDVSGSLRLEYPTQGKGKLLQVFGDGNMKWGTAVQDAVVGGWLANYGYDETFTDNRLLQGYITLPPGKWLVKVSFLLITWDSSITNKTVMSNMYFSESQTNGTKTADYLPNSAELISGTLIGPNSQGMAVGTALIQNTTTSPKTYYLWGKVVANPNPSTQTYPLLRVASNIWGENRVYALPFD